MHVRQALALAPILAFPADDLPNNGPWGDPVTIDRGAVSSPTAAVDDRDRATAAWLRGARELRAVVPGAGVLTVARTATQRLQSPEAATTARGAVFAWTRSGRVETRRASSSGRLSLVSQLSPEGRAASDPTFVGGTGGVVLAWELGLQQPLLQLSPPSRNGTFPGTVRYSLGAVAGLDLSTTRGGGLLAAYTRVRPGSQDTLDLMVAEQRPGSPRFVEIARMPAPAAPTQPAEPRVAVTSTGRSIVAWAEAGSRRVMVAERPRGGAFGDPVPFAAGGQPSRLALLPKADGTVLVSWVAARTPSQTAPGVLRIADVRGGAVASLASGIGDYAATVDGRGAAHFGWITGGRVSTRLVDDRERVGTRRTLSAPGENARSLSLAAGRRDVVAVWTTARAVRLASR